MKFRKKPVVIEAIQWNNLNREEINLFVGKELQLELESETAYIAGKGAPKFSIIIPTWEGNMKAMPNDWIIKGVKGEFYPCKNDIFLMTYEAVTEITESEQMTNYNVDAVFDAMFKPTSPSTLTLADQKGEGWMAEVGDAVIIYDDELKTKEVNRGIIEGVIPYPTNNVYVRTSETNKGYFSISRIKPIK